MKKPSQFPKRILFTLMLIFVVMISSVCVVYTSGQEAQQNTTQEEVAQEPAVPSKEEQISKHTQPLVEVDDVEAPLAQTTLKDDFAIGNVLVIVAIAVLVCVLASYHKKHRKTVISCRRVCKDCDEDEYKDREIER